MSINYNSPYRFFSNTLIHKNQYYSINKSPLIIKPNKIIFIVIYLSIFCFGFVISVLSNFNFRAAIISLLVLPLIVLYGLRVDRVFFVLGILALIVVFSGILNNSSISNILLFLRIPVFSYLIYYLVRVSLHSDFTGWVIKTSVWLAIIQLPIILIQWQIFEYLPIRLRGPAHLVDFASGTFVYKTDYAMSFFITMVIIFLLFDKQSSCFINNKFYKVLWLSITVLVANSQMMKIVLLLIWFLYILKNVNIRRLITIIIGFSIVSLTLIFMSKNSLITEDIFKFMYEISKSGDVGIYISGGYSRTAALRYLLTDGFSWFGDGPNTYYNPIGKVYLRGNMGHSFTFFSETGLIGWFISIFILFLIAFPKKNWKSNINLIGFLFFSSIFILSFTSNVMNDIGVMMAYCIFTTIFNFSSFEYKTKNIACEETNDKVNKIVM